MALSGLFVVGLAKSTISASGKLPDFDVVTFAEVVKNSVVAGLYDPAFFCGKIVKKKTRHFCVGHDSYVSNL